ncbi:hypothetical protein AABB24_030830, partial [Solanum stoloniferum]
YLTPFLINNFYTTHPLPHPQLRARRLGLSTTIIPPPLLEKFLTVWAEPNLKRVSLNPIGRTCQDTGPNMLPQRDSRRDLWNLDNQVFWSKSIKKAEKMAV